MADDKISDNVVLGKFGQPKAKPVLGPVGPMRIMQPTMHLRMFHPKPPGIWVVTQDYMGPRLQQLWVDVGHNPKDGNVPHQEWRDIENVYEQ